MKERELSIQKSRRPVKMIYHEEFDDKRLALKESIGLNIKKMERFSKRT